MSERYTKLFALPENLYTEGAPVIIAAGALLKDNETGKVLAQIKLKNISEKRIKAVKVAVRAFDVSGTEIEGIQEYQYLDLSAARDAEFGQKNAIALPDKVTRSFSCECKSIIFSDGTTWEEKGAEWKPLIQPEALQKRLGGLSAQYKRDTVKQAQFVVTDDRDLWICACGAINRQSEKRCHTCRSEKTVLLAALDMEALKEHNAAYNKRESERREKEAAEAAKKKAKTKKISIIAAACAVVVIAAIVVITQVIVPSGKYNAAVALMNEGKYDEAIETFEELGDYQDSAILLGECELLAEKEATYTEALTALENGEDNTAYSLFSELGDYKDSKEYLDKFELCLAEEISDSFSEGFASSVRTYEYDNNNLILSTLEYDTSLTTTVYEYSDDNVLTKTTDSFESSSGITSTTVKEYDEYGNVIREVFNNSNGSQSITTYDYTYDENGEPKTCEVVIVMDGQKNTTTFYVYDNNGGYSQEIRSSTGEIIGNYQLECDSNGNVISYKELKDGEIIDVEYEYSNTYDAKGNLIKRESVSGDSDIVYEWIYDENNLVTNQYISSGEYVLTETTYKYDYFYTD